MILYKELFSAILSFILAFSLVVLVIPPILRVAYAKKLFDSPNEQKTSSKTILPVGGVALFIGFVLSISISTEDYSFNSLKYIIASVILIFFSGLKKDLTGVSLHKKLAIQLVTAVLLAGFGNFHILNLHGLFGFHQINYAIGFVITVFTIITLINAFNLIDGIDGLVPGLGILTSFIFGTWFFISGHTLYAVISFALAGSLAGFFLYNVFGKKNKLFLGNSGSLITGLIVAVLIIKFNEFNHVKTLPYAIDAAPAVSFSIVIVPLIDTLRVITIRLANGKSPFTHDKNHIHHRLLELFPNHLTVTLIILSANIFIIALALLFNDVSFNITLQFLCLFLTGIGLSLVPLLILRWKPERIDKRLNLAEANG
jgi:UDP-N-acetylmuramyl pentapeptide phosphotransferase/UDP-N-acetylglucosamine-1-phosphate transferase